MRRRSTIPIVAALGCAFLGTRPGLCPAQLRWERTEVTFEASAAEQQAVGVFPFVNAGSYPVKIEAVKTGCGCTAVKLDRTQFAPGEGDRLVATFVFGGRKGPQAKTIAVRADDPKSCVKLTLAGTIREIAEMRPTFLYWKVGDPPAAKTATVRIVHESPVRILRVASATAAFRAALRELVAGRRYEIDVTPVDTRRQGFGRIDLFPEPAGGRPAPMLYLYARVK